MRRILSAFVVLALLASGAQAALIPGGDFESGGPPGLSMFGNTAIVSSVGTGPSVFPGGGLMFLTSSTGGSGVLADGSPPAGFFTGDPAGTGQAITSYSGFSFPLVVTVPSIASMMMNIMTSEATTGVYDLVAFYIDGGEGPSLVDGWAIGTPGTLTSPFESLPGENFDGAGIVDATFGGFLDGQTGWGVGSGPIAPGTYTVYVLVADVDDTVVDTAFGVDNISLTPVPEPGTWLLFGLGALGLAGTSRLRRRRSRK